MLRHVSETTAAIWVETDAPCRVTVTAGTATASADTFTVHDHHYALCELTGLAPGSALPYEVRLDGAAVWPEPDSPHPPSLVRTPDGTSPARIVFGSCRTPTDHGPAAVLRYGVDMVRAYALRLADQRRGQDPDAAAEQTGDLDSGEPTVLLMIGDQIYADEIQPSMAEFLRRRRAQRTEREDADPPVDEVVFFDEYAELYRQAWSDPDIRWLLSTVPTLMLFDDHDIRDDWNTSGTWRREIAENPWWRPRITSGLGTYWIYQHLGNLSCEERAADPVLKAVTAQPGDAREVVDSFAWRAHTEPPSYRWSYRYDIGRSRVLMVDNRCGRIVEDDARRTILGPEDAAWLDSQLTGDVDHLVLTSTLPFLMPSGVHYLEAWNEAVCAGAWGSRLRRPAEKMRQKIDLEHWAAFQRSFAAISDSVLRVAAGERGAPPASVLFLGGDVHFSYLARAGARDARTRAATSGTRIAQLVCSPTCNWLQPVMRRMMWVSARAITGLAWGLIARLAGVRPPALAWHLDDGPWYDNTLATLVLDGREADVSWEYSPLLKQTLRERSPGEAARPEVRRLNRYRLTG
ncbi:alkaline phosphatase D family protein [Spinactinospora alkalitolerans]|nr:alkaline phosphatase D family protein [Spinactinospora alkalitolerans]